MQNNQEKIDLSLIVNIHREAKYLARTFRSLHDACYELLRNEIKLELVVVLDNSDELTRSVARKWVGTLPAPSKTVEIKHANLADARTAGIKECTGTYISLHDADDLISYNYLSEKYKVCRENTKHIAIPEYLFLFGSNDGVTHYKEVARHHIINYHPYISQIMAHRSLFEIIPYENPTKSLQRAYEDWKFNSDATAHGFIFRVAKNTILFYRQHADSIMSKLRGEGVSFHTNKSLLHSPEVLRALAEEKPTQPTSDNTREQAISRLFHESPNTTAIDAAILIEPQISVYSSARAAPYFNWQTHSETISGILFDAANLAAKHSQSQYPWRHIFILHDLSEGGGEKYLLQVAEAAYQQCGEKSLFITLDKNPKNNWKDLISGFGEILNTSLHCKTDYDYNNLPEFVSAAVLRITEWSASKPFIHIKPSREAFDIQNRLIGKIPDKSFVNYRWCDEPIRSFHHRTWNPYNLKTLERHLPKIGAVLCDNQFIKERDQQYLGIELSSWHVVRAHVDTSGAHSHQSIPAGAVKKLMWAGRFAEQKRPALLAEIVKNLAKSLPDLHVDVYTPDHLSQGPAKTLPSTKNFTLKNPFSPTSPLKPFEYDALVYTSYFDGLPNIILEALSLGIPVIAPRIDGIPEAVIQDQTGYILSNPDKNDEAAQLYIDAIKSLYLPGELEKLRRGALEFIDAHHSRKQHAQSLLNISLIGKTHD